MQTQNIGLVIGLMLAKFGVFKNLLLIEYFLAPQEGGHIASAKQLPFNPQIFSAL